MYKTYFVNVNSLALPHGTFLKGQAVRLRDDAHTHELVNEGILSSTPKFEKAINAGPSSSTENVAKPDPVEVQSIEDTVPEAQEPPNVEDTSGGEELKTAPKKPVRKKRNGRRKRGSEGSS